MNACPADRRKQRDSIAPCIGSGSKTANSFRSNDDKSTVPFFLFRHESLNFEGRQSARDVGRSDNGNGERIDVVRSGRMRRWLWVVGRMHKLRVVRAAWRTGCWGECRRASDLSALVGWLSRPCFVSWVARHLKPRRLAEYCARQATNLQAASGQELESRGGSSRPCAGVLTAMRAMRHAVPRLASISCDETDGLFVKLCGWVNFSGAWQFDHDTMSCSGLGLRRKQFLIPHQQDFCQE